MYTRYAERKGWKSEVLSANFTDIGGVKELFFIIEGQGAYSRLKYELSLIHIYIWTTKRKWNS